ncbi:ATP-binding protein [Lentzea sp. NPDC051213]|uniref:ATP-binding protein n=1 Tax=Lentzea sp. NPDC051213 TaxID=3364126 RepID=UPI0037B60EB9
MRDQRTRPSLPLLARTTRFIGRTAELTSLRTVLTTARLITLTGPGGVGKSRLALEAACQANVDGVVLVRLDTVSDPGQVAAVTAEALGLGNTAGEPMTAIIAHLRDKNLLLLLDSCENAVPECGHLVRTVLAAAPDVRVLATSQRPLGQPDELVSPVGPLPVPAIRRLAEARNLDVVKLFADRAQALVPGFAITDDNWRKLVELCRRLDGIPLAVELAAAWLRVVPLDEVLSRMDDRFELLVRGTRDGPPRQRSLRAAVKWSFDLCEEPEKLLWSWLSVFRGTFDLAAAEAVCAGEGIRPVDVPQLMAELVEKSIVVTENGATGKRYRLLDALREYGGNLLHESHMDAELSVRHVEYYTRVAEREEAKSWRGEDELGAFDKIHAELANMRAALEYCADTPGQEAAGLRLAVLLHFYWLPSCRAEGRRWVIRALARNPGPGRDRAMGLWMSSMLAAGTGEPPDPEPARQAAAWAVDNHDERVLAHALITLAKCASQQGDQEAALAFAEDAAASFAAESTGTSGHLLSLAMAGQAQIWLGHVDAGIITAERALALIDGQAGERRVRAYVLLVHGLGHLFAGDLPHAEASLHQALRVADRFRDRFCAALLLELLAWVAADLGQNPWAAELLGMSGRLWSQLGEARLFRAEPLMRRRDRHEQRLKVALGEAGYEAAVRRGIDHDDNLGAVVRRALSGPRSKAGRVARSPSPLTERERQVAALTAEGMTNREIAAVLGIAQRTAETHVDRILRKLGLTSRTQLAAWLSADKAG